MLINNTSPLISSITDLKEKVTLLLRQMVSSTFIVEEQPSQVITKLGQFSAKIRLLVGSQLKPLVQSPEVRVTLVNEEQVKKIFQSKKEFDQGLLKITNSSGEIVRGIRIMEFDDKGVLSVHFNDMKIKGLKRPFGKSKDKVMNQKFCLLFKTNVKIEDEFDLNVWTLSLPFIIIVHFNQKARAFGAITWYNTFSDFVS